MIQRVYQTDPLFAPGAGGTKKVIDFIEVRQG
jgi:hypothetical protein